MSDIPITKKRVPKDVIAGSIGRKWNIDGVTQYPEGLPVINIEVYTTGNTENVVFSLAMLHELGHAKVCHDINDNQPSRTWEILTRYDRWEAEVEAWMRGIEGHTIDFLDATLILDCMNSYRRGIPASDEKTENSLTCSVRRTLTT